MTLVSQEQSRGPTHGPSEVFVLLNPFALAMAMSAAIVCGVLAFALTYPWLKTSTLWKTASLLYLVVALSLIAVGTHDIFRSLRLAFSAMLVAGIASRIFFSDPDRTTFP